LTRRAAGDTIASRHASDAIVLAVAFASQKLSPEK
jgi:hypothetical protein